MNIETEGNLDQKPRQQIPLPEKAWHLLNQYNIATGLNTEVLDKSGQVIKSTDFENQTEFCKYCAESHLTTLAESRKTGKTCVYDCGPGFVYWTSPLHLNGQYSGALVSGPVLLNNLKAETENFWAHCDSMIGAENPKIMKKIQKKSIEEIRAMALLSGICAREISGIWEEACESASGFFGSSQKASPVTVKARTKTALFLNTLENPLEKEQLLFAAFQRGDNETGCRIIDELLDNAHNGYYVTNLNNFEIMRIRALELTVLLSRAAAAPGTKSYDDILKANNRNLKRIQESKTREELKKNLHLAAWQMAGKIFSLQGIRHASVLRRAQRYIWENFTRKISLEEISKAAGLSAPYFSSVFKEEMGENLSSYLNRIRVEKAATLLTETRNPLNVIARLSGFEDQSWFSKIFKSITGVSPGKYRENGCLIDEYENKPYTA
ncbi:MAG: helix-turn-helix domain-containing protein [Treponema sp.]|jgi:AraC-like DNA-binding protein/ligand-binding sensor protein|nr:helix-turn-helix domain-containing protein [Treponema sp.]